MMRVHDLKKALADADIKDNDEVLFESRSNRDPREESLPIDKVERWSPPDSSEGVFLLINLV